MPIDKNKLLRFQTLDRCFSDQKNKYFFKDLKRACERSLENAGYVSPTVSRSTLYNDINEITTNPEWPDANLIESEDSTEGGHRYFRYAKPRFSIWKRDMSEHQLSQLQSILLILRQFKDFPQSDAIEELIAQFERSYHFELGDADGIIAFESNDNIEALSLVGSLFSHISHKHVLSLVYQPFQKDPIHYTMHPHFLKQYNRRWFLIGHTISDNKMEGRSVFPLDRIVSFEQIPGKYEESDLDLEDLFDDQIGVTIIKDEPVEVKLRFTPKRFQYVTTKPIHPSQKQVSEEENTIVITVKANKELYQTLYSFGSDLEVISPKEVKDKVIEEIKNMQKLYNCPETLD